MSSFALIVAAIALGWTIWLYRRYAVAPRYRGRTRALIGALILAGWGCFFWTMFHRDGPQVTWFNAIGMTWFAAAFYLALAAAAVGVLAMLARAFGARDRVLRIGTPLAALAALLTTGYGVWEAARPAVTHYRMSSADLPESADGLRVALVTDLHVGPVRGAAFTRDVVDQVNAADVDLVVLGGDLADGTVAGVGDALAPLADLEAPTYAVTGNHEYISGEPDKWVALWESYGITVLRNAHQRLDNAVVIAGVEDESGGQARFGTTNPPDYAAALEGTGDEFVILAAHQPSQAEQAAGRGVDLQLSGHTHGGQIWPFRYVVQAEQGTVEGFSRLFGVRVLTSRGAGAWGPPVRVLAPPEIPVLTLTRG